MLSLNEDANPLNHLISSYMRREDEDKDMWMPIHLKIIRLVIGELPPNLDFEAARRYLKMGVL